MSPSPGRGTAGPDVLKVCGRAQRSRAGCRARQTRRKAGGRTPVFTSHSGNAIFKPHYSRGAPVWNVRLQPVHSLQLVRSRLGVGSGLTGDEERCRIVPRVPLLSSFLCLTPNSVSEVAGKRRGDPAWSSPSCFCAPQWLHNPNQTRRTGRSFCAPPKRMKTMGNQILKAQRVKLILLAVFWLDCGSERIFLCESDLVQREGTEPGPDLQDQSFCFSCLNPNRDWHSFMLEHWVMQ